MGSRGELARGEEQVGSGKGVVDKAFRLFNLPEYGGIVVGTVIEVTGAAVAGATLVGLSVASLAVSERVKGWVKSRFGGARDQRAMGRV